MSLKETTAAVEEVYVASLPWLREQDLGGTAEFTESLAREVEAAANSIDERGTPAEESLRLQ